MFDSFKKPLSTFLYLFRLLFTKSEIILHYVGKLYLFSTTRQTLMEEMS